MRASGHRVHLNLKDLEGLTGSLQPSEMTPVLLPRHTGDLKLLPPTPHHRDSYHLLSHGWDLLMVTGLTGGPASIVPVLEMKPC